MRVLPRLIDSSPPILLFLVDLSQLNHQQDIFSDELGAWKQTDTSRKSYRLLKDHSGVTGITSTKDQNPDTLFVTRRPYINKSDKTLHKVLVNVEFSNGDSHQLVFVKYFFDGPGHKVVVKTHGNSKISWVPYTRTFKSTKLALTQEMESTKSVRRAIFNVTKDVGDVDNSICCGVLPKGKGQASYLRSKKKDMVDDPLLKITQTMNAYKEGDGERFIRPYTLDDGLPKVIAFTEKQMDDIINFCCNEKAGFKSLFLTDLTFQLGPFYVLLTSYTNTTLFVKGTNVCPTMLGPLILCMLKHEQTYITLFQKLKAHRPGLQVYLQGYATDSEAALRNVMAREFPLTQAFICTIHAKKNISEKCKSLGLSQALTSSIIRDIFGVGGLVYANSRNEFEKRFNEFKLVWNELESAEKRHPQFVVYFDRNKKEDIFDHMHVKLSMDAGFGDQMITTNQIESMNAVLKRWTNFQPSDMSTLLAEIKDCVDEQVSNVKKAYLSLQVPYTVRPEFQGHVERHYFQHDKAKHSSLALKPLKVRVDQKRYNEVLRYKAESGTSHLPLSDEDGESEDPFMKLVRLFTRPDVDNLKMKAVEIISSNGIRDGFASRQYIVRSSSDKYRTVSVLSNKMINCEKGCLGFDARKICSHTIATAMHLNTLSDYINIYVKNCPMNLTTMTTTGVNPDAGKKNPSRKRWRPPSPDAIHKSPNTVEASSVTLGEILATRDDQQSTTYSVSAVSGSGMKLKLKKKKKP